MAAREPRLTVVVLSRDRADELLHTLERLHALPEGPAVVVVDNGSHDGTPARVAAAFPSAHLIALRANVGAAARTLGVRAAQTEYVAFCDDDSWWEPGALGRAADLLDAHPTVGLLAARVLVGPEQELEPACEEMAASPLPAGGQLPGPRVLGFVACGAVVRRTAYLQAGGFHPRYGVGGEEALLAADLAAGGWQLVYVDELVAHHHPSPMRDHHARRADQVRNDLWFSWLRRPARAALEHTARAVRAAAGDPAARRGVRDALAGLPWVLRERRPVAEPLAGELRALDPERA